MTDFQTSPVLFFRLNTLKVTAKAPTVNLLRLDILRGNKKKTLFNPYKVTGAPPPPCPFYIGVSGETTRDEKTGTMPKVILYVLIFKRRFIAQIFFALPAVFFLSAGLSLAFCSFSCSVSFLRRSFSFKKFLANHNGKGIYSFTIYHYSFTI